MNGTLLIAGGNIGATEQGKADIFGRFSALCGGKRGKVMLAVCASGEAEESFRFNRELLLSAGIGEVVLLPLTEDPALLGRSGWTNRAGEALLPLFDGVSGVWFSGGDQLHTARLLLQPDGSDTPVLGRMRRLLSDGGVIGGSSAGAAIMSRTMIVRGDDSPSAPTRQLTVTTAAFRRSSCCSRAGSAFCPAASSISTSTAVPGFSVCSPRWKTRAKTRASASARTPPLRSPSPTGRCACTAQPTSCTLRAAAGRSPSTS